MLDSHCPPAPLTPGDPNPHYLPPPSDGALLRPVHLLRSATGVLAFVLSALYLYVESVKAFPEGVAFQVGGN